MKLSVAVASWNRSSSLRRTLDSFAAMAVPHELSWEVLVVNNNSNDDTDAVIGSFKDRLPIRRLFESRQGVSYAKNTAAHGARGDFILWTDDDVVVGRAWLVEYCAAFKRWPNAILFGGPICPVFEGPVPRWLERGWKSVPAVYAALDLGRAPVTFSTRERKIPYGSNFAIRREAQIKNPYDPRMGPGTRYYAEETTMIIKLLQEGAEGWWVPKATADHMIPRSRMTTQYIMSFYEKAGRTQYYVDSGTYIPDRAVRRRPKWIWRSVIETELRYWVARLFQPPDRWLDALRARAVAWGAFEESGRKY